MYFMVDAFWRAPWRALAVCLIAIGAVLLIRLTAAQKPREKNVVLVPAPSVAVHLSLLPANHESDVELRVRTTPAIKKVPKVEFQDTAGGSVREVKLEAEKDGIGWVGTITKIKRFGVGYIHVMATSDSGSAERYSLQFATRPIIKKQPNVVSSADGRFALVLLPAEIPAETGNVPADTRLIITSFAMANPPLPPGVKLEAGPYEIVSTKQIPSEAQTSIAFYLPEASPNYVSPRYQIRWLDPVKGAWEVLLADIDSNRPAAEASISRLGMFILTSEPK